MSSWLSQGTKLALAVPRELVLAPLWPILRSRALAALPERAGTLSGITALLGLLPLAGTFGWIGARVGLTATLLVVQLLALVTMLALVHRGTVSLAGLDAE